MARHGQWVAVMLTEWSDQQRTNDRRVFFEEGVAEPVHETRGDISKEVAGNRSEAREKHSQGRLNQRQRTQQNDEEQRRGDDQRRSFQHDDPEFALRARRNLRVYRLHIAIVTRRAYGAIFDPVMISPMPTAKRIAETSPMFSITAITSLRSRR